MRRLPDASPALIGARLAGTALAGLTLAALTQCAVPPEPLTVVEQGLAIAEVFETAEPYSPVALDSVDLTEFFDRYPEYRPDSAAVADFYERRHMQFAWILNDSLSASAEAFMALTGVAEPSAPPAAPGNRELAALYEETVAEGGRIGLCEGCATDVELRLTAEFFRFADRNYNGYLSRDLHDLNWFIPRTKKDLPRLLDSLAVRTLDLSAYEPIHPQYQLLRANLQSYRALAEEPWPQLELPAGVRSLDVGDSAAAVPEIRRRLRLMGDLEGEGESEVFDSTMVPAVRRFQERHGLQADGVMGPNFLREINTTPAERQRTMLINMERLRWVPEVQPPNLLLVNIPEFRLHVYEGDQEVMSMEVVVGTAATRTVIFSDSVSHVVFSPTWTVPTSITRNEILPALARDPNYLRDRDMEIIGGSATNPVIRQNPGPNNALGRVKFIFPNSYSIYMHDTPARSLFGAEQRAFSHGCIRLSRPRDLAEYLLRDNPTWTPERIDEAMLSGRELFVPLAPKRPVVIAYFTAWVDTEGRLNFRDDVYGHDERLASELFL